MTPLNSCKNQCLDLKTDGAREKHVIYSNDAMTVLTCTVGSTNSFHFLKLETLLSHALYVAGYLAIDLW